MKKILLLLFSISVFGIISAQTYSQKFQEVFQHVNLNQLSTGILYDRVLPFSNITRYTLPFLSQSDTCDYYQFVLAYDELYHAGAHVVFLLDSVEKVLRETSGDSTTITIGMLHAKFNTFDTAALRQKLYFDSDSILRENTNVNVSLFNEKTVLLFAPLVESTGSKILRFIFDEQYFFDNTSNPITFLKINFGDGQGNKLVAIDSTINVVYPTGGTKTIRIVSFFQNGDSIISHTKLYINNPNRNEGSSCYEFTEDFSVSGAPFPYNPYPESFSSFSVGAVRVYYANEDKQLRKPVLIVDGFDPLNNRRFDTCVATEETSLWEKLGDGLDNGDNVGEMLLNLGYDVVMLDFPEGGAYIEQNAMVCISAINLINEKLQLSGSEHQIIVVGPSMGGQITRLALSYMEKNPCANTNFGYHNCRLWISFDSPHQGANISMGTQALVDYFRIENGSHVFAKLWNNTLCCKAAQQMLVYHKKNGAGNIYHTYQQQLSLFRYPLSSRNIAISNGSLNGTANGTANGITMEIDVKPQILAYNLNLRVRHMANQGEGQVFKATHWLGYIPIPITWTYTNQDNRGNIDIAPGCKYYTFDIIANKMPQTFINMGVLNVVQNEHSHCFMPITSVLDINAPIPYATDVSNIDLVAEGIIPFDSYWGPLNKNMEHITFDYDLVDYLLNEIETYIVGQREIQLCTRPSYTMHLPQSTTATVTWYGSDNIQIVPTNNPNVVNVIPLYEGDAWICADVSTLGHKKNLAHYPIHISSNSSFTPTVSGTTIQGQSMLVDDTRYLASDTFCVENGKTLTVTGTLYCAAGTRIIVRPGGKLIVDGGTLTSACTGEMWQGIEVVGDRTKHQTAANQGTVTLLNGATIENAHCAIRTGLEGNADGIVQCTGSTLRNDMADGCTLPGCVVKSYNNKPLPHFSVFKFLSKLLLLSMSQNPPGSTPFIPSHCLYPSQDNQNFRHNFGIKPVFHGKISAYWHNCFFSKKIKKLVFCGRNAYFCSTISFLPCITGLARQERGEIEKLIDGRLKMLRK